MKTLARIASQTPEHAMEDALGLAALCLMLVGGLALTGMV